MSRLYRITLDYACFGVILRAGVVIRTAPIASWMLGKTLEDISRWVKFKQGRIEHVPELMQSGDPVKLAEMPRPEESEKP
jgi:hypothetical protein